MFYMDQGVSIRPVNHKHLSSRPYSNERPMVYRGLYLLLPDTPDNSLLVMGEAGYPREHVFCAILDGTDRVASRFGAILARRTGRRIFHSICIRLAGDSGDLLVSSWMAKVKSNLLSVLHSTYNVPFAKFPFQPVHPQAEAPILRARCGYDATLGDVCI